MHDRVEDDFSVLTKGCSHVIDETDLQRKLARKKPLVGPSSGSVAAHTMPAAPSATGRPPLPPMSVATQPGQTALTRMASRRSSAAKTRVSALSAALETR